MFLLACLAAVSRGVFEVTVGKTAGYAIQLGAFVVLTLVLLAAGARPGPRARVQCALGYGFVVVVVASCLLTSLVQNVGYFWYYAGVMVFFAAMFVVYGGLELPAASRIAVGPTLSLVTTALVGTALLQQFRGWSVLPSSDEASLGGTVRPASLTGSYLHYPLAAALLTFLLLEVYRRGRRTYVLAAAALALAGVVLSYSRSGYLVLAAGGLFYLLSARDLGARLRLVGAGVLAFVALVSLGLGRAYFDRGLSSFDLAGSGNDVRIGLWHRSVEQWLGSGLLVGQYTGMASNVTRNLGDTTVGVVESGFFQQLLSFGLLGVVLFYALMLGVRAGVPREAAWLRAGMLGALLESVVYQSIEVLPYVFFFCVAGVVGQSALESRDGDVRERRRPGRLLVAAPAAGRRVGGGGQRVP
ncbi:O-antigen ligase-like membrane protein [Luteimicrobium subarcticum]|uniref:O-antigen ligase-like membrane protein n=1 Tax=Luteimicrobium subarcticum TaxID=620910 RepID=A0A2M8WUX0_9MICO|nr:O-antigen ligase-like membrane protein [Luteimicrobium subarcticum]